MEPILRPSITTVIQSNRRWRPTFLFNIYLNFYYSQVINSVNIAISTYPKPIGSWEEYCEKSMSVIGLCLIFAPDKHTVNHNQINSNYAIRCVKSITLSFFRRFFLISSSLSLAINNFFNRRTESLWVNYKVFSIKTHIIWAISCHMLSSSTIAISASTRETLQNYWKTL